LDPLFERSDCESGERGAARPGQDKLRWYLVRCKPNEDERARENLERQGFECFRPVRPVRPVERRRHGRKCHGMEALFPRYLFIHLDSVHDNWYPIRSTRGVNQIVRFNEHPLPVGDAIIEEIRARLAGTQAPEPYLKPGQRVEITEGAFRQLEAIFVSSSGDERVVLLLQIMQTEQKLEFPSHCVRKIG
jgi:transcriptional antiterminator RfaH